MRTQDDPVYTAKCELRELAEAMASDFQRTVPGATPAGLRELTLDYAHNNPQCPMFNAMCRSDQDRVAELVDWPQW